MFLRSVYSIILISCAFFFTLSVYASESGKLTIDILQKTKPPVHFFSQSRHTPSEFVILNNRDDIKDIRRGLNHPVLCKYDEEFENRFLDLFSIACGAIVPVEDADIIYNHFEDDLFIPKFDHQMTEGGWVFTEDREKMDIVFLIECESTNLLRMNKLPLWRYLGGLKSTTVQRHASVIKIVGVKLPGTRSEDTVIKAKFEMYTRDRLTDVALQNAIARIVPEIQKLKPISKKRAKNISFNVN